MDEGHSTPASNDSQPSGYPFPPVGTDPRELGRDVPAVIKRSYPTEPDRIIVLVVAVVAVEVAELGLVGPTLTPVTHGLIDIATWALVGIYAVAVVV